MPHGQDMIQAAEADVVGPAVAAHEPDAFCEPGSRPAAPADRAVGESISPSF